MNPSTSRSSPRSDTESPLTVIGCDEPLLCDSPAGGVVGLECDRDDRVLPGESGYPRLADRRGKEVRDVLDPLGTDVLLDDLDGDDFLT